MKIIAYNQQNIKPQENKQSALKSKYSPQFQGIRNHSLRDIFVSSARQKELKGQIKDLFSILLIKTKCLFKKNTAFLDLSKIKEPKPEYRNNFGCVVGTEILKNPDFKMNCNKDDIKELKIIFKNSIGKTLDTYKLKLTPNTYNRYELPREFAIACFNSLQQKGNAHIIEKVPKLFNDLDIKEVFKQLDLLPIFFTKRTTDLKKTYIFRIADKTFSIKSAGSGVFGQVFKIQDTKKLHNAVAMKIFKDPDHITRHGCYAEIGISRELTRANVINVPKLYMANPIGDYPLNGAFGRGKGGWMISQFVTPDTKFKKHGQTLFNFLTKYGLFHTDSKGNNKVGKFYVDLGGIQGDKVNEPIFARQLIFGIRKGETVEQILEAICKYEKNMKN